MAQFQFATTQGTLSDPFEAANEQEALKALSGFQNVAPTSGVLRVQNQAAPTAVPQEPITTDSLSPSAPVNLPPAPMPAPTPDFTKILEQMQQQINTPSPAEVQAQQERTGILGRIEGLLDKRGGQAARQTELEQQAGLPEQQRQLKEITDQIRQLNVDAFGATQKSENRLAPTFAIQGEQAQIERQRAVRQAGLAASAQAVQGNIALARQTVEQALEMEFGGIEAQLDFQKLLLDENRATMTSAEKRRADALSLALDERKRLLQEQKAERDQVYNTMLAAAERGADNSTLQRIQNAQTQEEALQIASGSGVFAQESDDFQFISGTSNQPSGVFNKSTGQFIPTGGGGPVSLGTQGLETVDTQGNVLQYGTPEYVMERLRQTSGSTTKPVAAEREQLGKFANVVALTGNLVNSLDETTNDPIIGYLRSLNPYDFDAKTVNAQVTALVPSVARALYGEVGVLTDTDIERYIRTLPNLRSTRDQNKFIALMTLANARRSYEQTLLNLASSNVNVSGFVDSYKNITDEIKTLEQELGVGATQEFDSEVGDLEFADNDGGGIWDTLKGFIGIGPLRF